MTKTILIVEDEQAIADSIAYALRTDGFTPLHVTLGEQALAAMRAEPAPALVVLDVGLPDMSGLEVCRRLRQFSDAPIMFLTARSDEIDRIVGLEIGADDYIPKPFEPRELLTRIQTILRRARAPQATPQKLVFDGIEIDLERRQVLRQGEPVELTGTEFELLAMLARAPQKVFHRDEILNRLRGQDADLYTRAVDILVSRLRKKLEPLDCIKTLRNAGYAFAGAHT